MALRSNLSALVVIPTYNERENIARIVKDVLVGTSADVLVVDDGSPDGTAEIVLELVSEHTGRVSILQREKKMGLGSAYLAGFAEAKRRGYEMVCEMDGDGSHEVKVLPGMMISVQGGYDLAIGSRRVMGGRIEGWGLYRHLMSLGATILSRSVLGLKTKDITSGFRCYRISLADKLVAYGVGSDGYAFQEETVFLAERFGARIIELPIVFRDRVAGRSKLGWREVIQFFLTILRLRFSGIRPGKGV